MTAALIGVGLIVAVALLAAGPLPRRVAAFVLLAVGFATPFFLPNALRWHRAAFGMAMAWTFMKTCELVRTPGMSPSQRLLHAFSLVDTRRLEAAPRRLRFALIVRLVVFSAIAFGGILLAFRVAPHLEGVSRLLVRWLGGVVLIYASFEGLVALLHIVCDALGVKPQPLHDAPLLARSVGEFWGKRWNRVVAAWLDRQAFRPVMRRFGTSAGIVAAFLVSGLLHGYFLTPALGLAAGAVVASFFFVQAPAVLGERALHIERWNDAVARVWTIGFLLVTSPLIIEPCLRVISLVGQGR